MDPPIALGRLVCLNIMTVSGGKDSINGLAGSHSPLSPAVALLSTPPPETSLPVAMVGKQNKASPSRVPLGEVTRAPHGGEKVGGSGEWSGLQLTRQPHGGLGYIWGGDERTLTRAGLSAGIHSLL